MSIILGNTELKNALFLAPMAGYSDRAMRHICHAHGAEASVTEMVSATAVAYGDRKTFDLAKILPDEGPVLLQIFGKDPSVMAESAAILYEAAETKPIAIDVNMGCPVKKIFSNGEGSALMKDPRLIESIVSSIRRAIPIPVTVKMRAGISSSSINAPECALAAESGGASLITLHGRTREQLYGGLADREIIKNVKSCLHIPLIANGDVIDSASAIAMLKETGADGIAIGRGAVGNPFVFEEIAAAIEGAPYTPPTLDERCETALLQLSVAIEEKGERVAVNEARKQIALFLRSFRGAARIRAEINRAETYEAVKKALLEGIREQDEK